MRQHRTVLGLGLLLIGGAITALTIATRPDPIFHPPASDARSAGSSSADPPRLGAAPGDQPGSRRSYAVDARYEIDLGDASSGPLTVQVAGTWQLTVVRADRDGILVQSELAAQVSVGPAQRAGVPDADAAAELARPHYIALAPDGRVTSFHFRPGQNGLARGIVRSLATASQLVGADAAGDAWQADESDQTGRYVASYRRTARSDGATTATIEKTKLAYAATPGRFVVADLASHAVFQTAGAVAASVSADEKLALTTGRITLASQTRVSLRLIGGDAVPHPAADLEGFELVAVDGAPGSARDSGDADRRLLGSARLPDLLAELAGGDARVSASVGVRLTALLRLEPGRAVELAAQVPGADERRASVLLGALGNAGTAEAQAALIDLAGSAAPNRAQAAVAMAMVEHPTAELTEALGAGLDASDAELRSSSGLALGVAASRLAGEDASRARSIVDDLLARLDAAGDPEQQVLLLRALGNAGDPRAIPAIRVALASTSSRVRRAAIEALHGFADPIVDDAIARLLAGDPDASVRRGAVFAAGQRPLGPLLDSLGRALGADRDTGVRLAIVRLLGRNLAIGSAAALLDGAARSDPAENVRAEARQLLASS